MATIHVILIRSINASISDAVNDAFWGSKAAADDVISILNSADVKLTEEYSLKALARDHSNDLYVIEAHTESAAYVQLLLSLELVSKIIVYTLPIIDADPVQAFSLISDSIRCRSDSTKLLGNVLRTTYSLRK